MKEVLTALETLEESEQIKNQIKKMKGKGNKENNHQRDNRNSNRNGPNSKCRKEGHDHLWKDCPDNPRNRNGKSNRGKSRENNVTERSRDDSGERENNHLSRENNAMVSWSDTLRYCNVIEKEESSQEEMPLLEEHASSGDEEDLEYVEEEYDNKEDSMFLFGLGIIDPRAEFKKQETCNLIVSKDEEDFEDMPLV